MELSQGTLDFDQIAYKSETTRGNARLLFLI